MVVREVGRGLRKRSSSLRLRLREIINISRRLTEELGKKVSGVRKYKSKYYLPGVYDYMIYIYMMHPNPKGKTLVLPQLRQG